jgi:hypothetical protein
MYRLAHARVRWRPRASTSPQVREQRSQHTVRLADEPPRPHEQRFVRERFDRFHSGCPAHAPLSAFAANTLTHSLIIRVHASSVPAAFSTLRDGRYCIFSPAIDSKRVALAKHALARSYECRGLIHLGPPASARDERAIVSTRFAIVVRSQVRTWTP